MSTAAPAADRVEIAELFARLARLLDEAGTRTRPRSTTTTSRCVHRAPSCTASMR
ncbi:hypothetical protein ACFQ3Z_02845 [Streptomyces nogalater]